MCDGSEMRESSAGAPRHGLAVPVSCRQLATGNWLLNASSSNIKGARHAVPLDAGDSLAGEPTGHARRVVESKYASVDKGAAWRRLEWPSVGLPACGGVRFLAAPAGSNAKPVDGGVHPERSPRGAQ